MKPLSKIARLFFVFGVIVLIGNLGARLLKGAPLFQPLDLLTLGATIVFGIAQFKDNLVIRIFQLIFFLMVGFFTARDGNLMFGLALAAIAFLLAYKFGFFEKWRRIKISVSYLVLFLALCTLNKPTEYDQGIASFLWVGFALVIVTALRYAFEDEIQKARAFDLAEIERRKADETRLISIAEEAIEIGKGRTSPKDETPHE